MLVKDTARTKIEAMIAEAEGKATARTITYSQIESAIQNLEAKLNIPKKHMEGIEAYVDINAQDFPKAYHYTPSSTHIKLQRKKSGWDLVKIYRDTCRRPERRYELKLTEAAKEAILQNFTQFM